MPKGIYKRKKLTEEHRRNIGISNGGKNHWNWQGGKTQEANKIRNSLNYKLWREAVFKRDDWTCQTCKARGGYLEAHHVEEFAKSPEKRLQVDNGVTMCRECHAKTKGHGRVLSKLSREKIKKALLGGKRSEESKRKMSIAKKGMTPWNKGKKKERTEIECQWCHKKFKQKRTKQTLCSRICTGQRNGRFTKNLLENKLTTLSQ